MMSPKTTIAVLVLLIAPSTSDAFQATLCPGDSWQARYSRAREINSSTIDISTTSYLNHSASHPSCGSAGDATPIGAKASMVGGLFSWCEAEAIEYDGMHEGGRTAGERCRDLSCDRLYTNNGTHYYDRQQAGTSQGNAQLNCPPPAGCDVTQCEPQECEEGLATLEEDCCCSSPIVIDVAGKGLEFSNVDNGVLFEIGGPGRARWVAWPTGEGNAWLARDLNGNEMIDDGSELFGTATRLRDGSRAPHGYAALAELDANGDGLVSSVDPEFRTLLLWRDRNRNGVSEPGELSRPSELDVAEFAVKFQWSKKTDQWGNMFALQSWAAFLAMPRQREAYDVFLLSESPFKEER